MRQKRAHSEDDNHSEDASKRRRSSELSDKRPTVTHTPSPTHSSSHRVSKIDHGTTQSNNLPSPNSHQPKPAVAPSKSPSDRQPEFKLESSHPKNHSSPSSVPPKPPVEPTTAKPARLSSPPRQRKRPGGASRISTADREAARQRQAQREQELADLAKSEAAARGVHDVVRQHYNTVPERGREWRKTDSRIRGLRSFNNWVKSVLVHKFSPNEDFKEREGERCRGYDGHGGRDEGNGPEDRGILVLDIGCGKGGDLQKWHLAPQRVDLYVGLDPADVSISQAKERYEDMRKGGRGRGGFHQRNRRPRLFHAELLIKDCYGEWIGDVPIVQEVGIDPSVGPDGNAMNRRWGSGGFDVVSMMFCMHYAFESEAKARCMLKNVAGSLRKGGRFLGVIPNSDVLSAKTEEHHKALAAQNGREKIEDADDDWDPEKPAESTTPPQDADGENEKSSEAMKPLEWGNSIYRVKFPGRTPSDGVFRPPFGWKYFYFLEEAVAEVPEYVVPWEAFRA